MKIKLHYDYVPAQIKSEKVMVAIHGWQGNRHSLKPLAKSLNYKSIDWFFLEAPYKVKENCFSWSYEKDNGEWEINEPKALLNQFFNQILKKYSSTQIYVTGFSQGGLVCLDFILFLNKPLGGVFSLSGFLRNPKLKINRFHSCQKHTPIIISHGIDDEVVPVKASKNAYSQLHNQGANVELLLYRGKHKIGVECLRKIKSIIQN